MELNCSDLKCDILVQIYLLLQQSKQRKINKFNNAQSMM